MRRRGFLRGCACLTLWATLASTVGRFSAGDDPPAAKPAADAATANALANAKALDAKVEALYGQRKYTEATPLARDSLAISEKILGLDHPETDTRLDNLALLLQEMGDSAGAKPLFVRALAISERAQGPDHPETGVRLNNLALLLQEMGDSAGAKPLYVRALAISEKALGPDHPSTGTSLNNLALLLQAMGDYAGAKPFFVRALAISEKARRSPVRAYSGSSTDSSSPARGVSWEVYGRWTTTPRNS